jgi:hypothetical protein
VTMPVTEISLESLTQESGSPKKVKVFDVYVLFIRSPDIRLQNCK